MPKTILGVDMGYDSLKLALVSGGRVKKTACVPMSKNLLREGRVVSPEAMTELLRAAMKESGIRASRAAVVLSEEVSFSNTVTMPAMDAEQLAINLPYEFGDFITGDLKAYAYDYKLLSLGQDAEGRDTMELLAGAAPLAVLEEQKALLRKAGLKLAKAAPAVCAYASLLSHAGQSGGHCFIDLGFRGIRMYIFQNGRPQATRELEIGLSALDTVVAEAMDVDTALAHTYLLSDYQGCRDGETCRGVYANIAVELLRSLNFYRFSNSESELDAVWLCGGGAVIEPLRAALAETLELPVRDPAQLLPGGRGAGELFSFIPAVGITLD